MERFTEWFTEGFTERSGSLSSAQDIHRWLITLITGLLAGQTLSDFWPILGPVFTGATILGHVHVSRTRRAMCRIHGVTRSDNTSPSTPDRVVRK